jgi:hypothetical protein
MIFTITRTFSGAPTEWLLNDGNFKVKPKEEEIKVFDQYDKALDATVELQVKHDLAHIKSPCTYSLNRFEKAAEAHFVSMHA